MKGIITSILLIVLVGFVSCNKADDLPSYDSNEPNLQFKLGEGADVVDPGDDEDNITDPGDDEDDNVGGNDVVDPGDDEDNISGDTFNDDKDVNDDNDGNPLVKTKTTIPGN